MRGRARLARYAAPAAFLAAVTVAVLLVRSGLENGESAPPPPTTTAQVTTTAPAETTVTETGGGTTTEAAGAEFYEIQSGDTLAVVADRFDTTVEQLLVLNPDVDPVALTIGQRIRVK
ncbi:MAG TPA: LysM domain-containing protein [Gaiellaceae bacterium]|nr:LysM domain-containing protein [Gaiellaceae bacterium]